MCLLQSRKFEGNPSILQLSATRACTSLDSATSLQALSEGESAVNYPGVPCAVTQVELVLCHVDLPEMRRLLVAHHVVALKPGDPAGAREFATFEAGMQYVEETYLKVNALRNTPALHMSWAVNHVCLCAAYEHSRRACALMHCGHAKRGSQIIAGGLV